MEQKLHRVAPDAKNRCQAVVKMGQCPYQAVENGNMCPMHCKGGTEEAKNLRNYRLSQWGARVAEFADNSQVKSLREEIGLLRLILEETLGLCKTSGELLIYSGKIADLTMKIEKLVSSCHRLEMSTGALLDKAALLQTAATLIEIIGRHVKDEILLNAISNEFLTTIRDSNNGGEVS